MCGVASQRNSGLVNLLSVESRSSFRSFSFLSAYFLLWLLLFFGIVSMELYPMQFQNNIHRIAVRILGPAENYSYCGSYVELRYVIDFFDIDNLRINAPLTFADRVNPGGADVLGAMGERDDYLQLSLCIHQNGELQGCLEKGLNPTFPIAFGPIHDTFQAHYLELDAYLHINRRTHHAGDKGRVLSNRSGVWVSRHPPPVPPLVNASAAIVTKQLAMANEVLQSLSNNPYEPLSSSVVICAEEVTGNDFADLVAVGLVLSPQLLQIWYFRSKSSEDSQDPTYFRSHPAVAVSLFELFSLGQEMCRHNSSCIGRALRAQYDVSVIILPPNPVSKDRQQQMTLLEALFERTSGHLVIICAKEDRLDFPTHESKSSDRRRHKNDIEFELLKPDKIHLEYMFMSGEDATPDGIFHARIYYNPISRLMRQKMHYDNARDDWQGGIEELAADAIDMPASVRFSRTNNSGNMHYAVMRTGCIDPKSGALFIPVRTDADVQQIHFDALNQQLRASGFLPFLPLRPLFLPQTGWPCADGRCVYYINSSAAVMKAYYDRNIYHHFQSVAGLLGAAYEEYNRAGQYPWVKRLKYLLLPSYDSRSSSQYEWNNRLLDTVINYYCHLRRGEDSATECDVLLLSAQQMRTLMNSSFETSDSNPFDEEFEKVSLQQIICFREMVLIGQPSTRGGFFASRAAARHFREFAADDHFRKIATTSNETPREAKNDDGKSESSNSMDVFDSRLRQVLHPEEWLSSQYPAQNLPNHLLRITVVLRYSNRRILNLPLLHRCLRYYNGDLNKDVIAIRWEHLEALTFREQQMLMQETDIFIAVHGSAFINAALFMGVSSVRFNKDNSFADCNAADGEQLLGAGIALMQSRHIEFALPQVVQQSGGVRLHILPVLQQNQSIDCEPFPEDKCVWGMDGLFSSVCDAKQLTSRAGEPACRFGGSLLRAGKYDCLGIRNCDVFVDAIWFEALFALVAAEVTAALNDPDNVPFIA